MNRELEDYYLNRFELTSTKGWFDLIEDVNTLRSSIDSIKTIKVDDLRYVQGQLDIIDWLLELRKVSEDSFSQLQGEDNGN